MVSLPSILILVKIAVNAGKIALFYLCLFSYYFEYTNSPDTDFTAFHLFLLKV